MRIYKDKAEIYDLFINKTGREYTKVVEFIEKYLTNNDRILELGGASGGISLVLKEKGYEVVCSDINEEILELAKKRGLYCIRLDMRRFDVDKKFDIILSLFNTLSYNQSLEDLKNNAKSVYEALNDGGRFIIETTNPELLLPKRKDFTHLWELNDRHQILEIDEFEGNVLFHRFVIIDLKTRECVLDKHRTVIFTSKEILDALNLAGFKRTEVTTNNNALYFISYK